MIGVGTVMKFSLAAEGATALAVLLVPGLVATLLFGSAGSAEAAHFGRLAGIALLALVLACWPGSADVPAPPAFRALLAYNLFAALFLAYLGLADRASGWLLWPAVIEHALVAALMAGGRRRAAS